MAKQIKEGLCFRISKVALVDSKQEHVSAPKKVVIDLAPSHLDPGLATGGLPPKPEPALTVAHVPGFKATQRFDVTALVSNVSQSPRRAGPNLKVFDTCWLTILSQLTKRWF